MPLSLSNRDTARPVGRSRSRRHAAIAPRNSFGGRGVSDCEYQGSAESGGQGQDQIEVVHRLSGGLLDPIDLREV
jgi:hypothetical protein